MLEGLRVLVRDLNFATHGVPAFVGGVSTRIVWLTPSTENQPSGNEFQRAEPRRVMAIRRDQVPAVPRGTLVSVTEHLQTAPAIWRIDSMERIEPDHFRAVVVPGPPSLKLEDGSGLFGMEDGSGHITLEGS